MKTIHHRLLRPPQLGKQLFFPSFPLFLIAAQTVVNFFFWFLILSFLLKLICTMYSVEFRPARSVLNGTSVKGIDNSFLPYIYATFENISTDFSFLCSIQSWNEFPKLLSMIKIKNHKSITIKVENRDNKRQANQ